jgi:hypothetical protein
MVAVDSRYRILQGVFTLLRNLNEAKLEPAKVALYCSRPLQRELKRSALRGDGQRPRTGGVIR